MSEALPELFRQMMEPEFYPHEVCGPIRLVQTHISWILLTGHYAYKIKKPVDFGFLDFTTLEKRAHFCREELRLNQRFSPEIYLKVIPLNRDNNGTWQFEGDGEVGEYALQMREFSQDALWSNLFEHQLLTPEMMKHLGCKMARFHAGAPTDSEISAYGDPCAIRDVAEDNYRASLPFSGSLQTEQQRRQTRAFSERFFRVHGELLARRRDMGFIRECHGDLHLNNICMLDGRIHVFDCVEFNREFRCIDPVYDVAFLLVDLEYRNRRDLGWTFFNAWMEWSGDFEGATLMPLYCSMRAYIRAKIYSFQTKDEQIDGKTRRMAAEKARRFYHLAWSYARPHDKDIWIVRGLSGSGKSTVSAYLSRKLGAAHIRSDAVRKHMSNLPLTARGGPELYTPARTLETYTRMADLAVDLAGEGIPVVLDAKYDRRLQRRILYEKAQKEGITVRIIDCYAPLEVLAERLRRRIGDVSDATPDLLRDQVFHEEPFMANEGAARFLLNTHSNWQAALDSYLMESKEQDTMEQEHAYD